MANYCGFTRTNYFRVTDEEEYKHIFAGLIGDNGSPVEDFTKEEHGVILHGFGAYSSIDFCPSDIGKDDPDFDFDSFIDMLQSILPEGEAFIMTEVGYEKLRYLTGYTLIATKNDVEIINLHQESIKIARQMLGNPNFETDVDY